MKIGTERLVLRDLKQTDAKSIVENVNNLNVTKWLLVVPYPYALKDAKWFINECMKKAKKKDRTSYDFGIELKGEKRIIGVIGMTSIDKYQGTATIGYWIGEKYQGKGYGTEALRAWLDFAFNKLKLRRLNAAVFVGNPSSAKLLTKFGFRLEGTKIKSNRSKADGKIYDEEIYGLLKEDYSGE